jgi:uncharacterized protein (TIGR00266 family)
MNELFNVILTGTLLDDTPREKALEAFAKLFKLSPEDAAKTWARAPVAIKKNADEKTAQAFSDALTGVGVGHRIESANAAPAEPLAVQPATVPAEAAPLTRDAVSVRTIEPPHPQGYAFRIDGKPDYAFLTVQLPADHTLKVEASAMATMDTHIKMKTKFKGGIGRMLTGENIFINEFTAQNAPGEIGIAPATPGDLMHQYLDGDTLYLQNSAFVACAMDVAVETKWQGLLKGFFSSEGLFLIRCSGRGDLWFNTYGASIEIDVTEDYVVDTGNIVAFTEGLEYKITKVGGYKSLFFSGEGFVCRFSGRGKVWIQTRTPGAFVSWANWFRPSKKG